MMKTVGTFDAKTHLSQYLAEVQREHTEICIQKRGRNVAILKAYENAEAEDAQTRAREVLKELRDIRESEGKYASFTDARSLRDEGRKR